MMPCMCGDSECPSCGVAQETLPPPTLNETLATLGYTTEPAAHAAKHILRDGEVVFTGTARRVWKWLHETGQVEQ